MGQNSRRDLTRWHGLGLMIMESLPFCAFLRVWLTGAGAGAEAGASGGQKLGLQVWHPGASLLCREIAQLDRDRELLWGSSERKDSDASTNWHLYLVK